MRASSRLLVLFLVACLFPWTFDPSPLPVDAAEGQPVISQIFGDGGPNAAVPWDYVELFNPGPGPLPLAGWSVQHASRDGGNWSVVELSGAIPASAHYLVRQGQQQSTGTVLPNALGLPNLSQSGGKLALVRGTTKLTCTTTAQCLADPTVVDLVGYGPATAFEGSAPAPAAPAGMALVRSEAGDDTDDNAADFSAQAPNPRSNPTSGPACTLVDAAIHEIQGATHRSWHEGCAVQGLLGTVTAVRGDGFFLQDAEPDTDEATSEGIVVTGDPWDGLPPVAEGDLVTIDDGQVVERRMGDGGLTTTQIAAETYTVTPEAGAPIAPVTIGSGERIPPALLWDLANGHDVEASPVFDPSTSAIDFFESLEGMLVDVAEPLVVGPTSSGGEVVVLADGGAGVTPRSASGSPLVAEGDFNPERIILDDGLLLGTDRPPMPSARVGDRLSDPCCTGVLDYAVGTYRVLLLEEPTLVSGGLAPEATAGAAAGELAIATFNVENLDPGDGPEKFARLAEIIVGSLGSPDMIAVEEIQDRSGAVNDRVVDAGVTFAMLVDAITEAGGPCYQYRQINPLDNQDGGETGGNIRQGFLFRTDRGLSFVDRPGGDAVTAVTVEPGPELSVSPGRIDPGNDAFSDRAPAGQDYSRSRKPLVGHFQYQGEVLFVIANHFSSKGPDAPLFGRVQEPPLVSEAQRIAQAQVVRLFVDELLDADPEAKIVVMGDLNEFAFAEPVQILLDGGEPARDLTNVLSTLPVEEQYTYIFTGKAQAIDHILVSAPLAELVTTVDVVHVNAEFPDAASDHDPMVVHLALSSAENSDATPVTETC